MNAKVGGRSIATMWERRRNERKRNKGTCEKWILISLTCADNTLFLLRRRTLAVSFAFTVCVVASFTFASFVRTFVGAPMLFETTSAHVRLTGTVLWLESWHVFLIIVSALCVTSFEAKKPLISKVVFWLLKEVNVINCSHICKWCLTVVEKEDEQVRRVLEWEVEKVTKKKCQQNHNQNFKSILNTERSDQNQI